MKAKREKKDLLNRFLETASDSWDVEEMNQIFPTIERTVDAVWTVEQFELPPEEEPMVSSTHFHQKDVKRETDSE